MTFPARPLPVRPFSIAVIVDFYFMTSYTDQSVVCMACYMIYGSVLGPCPVLTEFWGSHGPKLFASGRCLGLIRLARDFRIRWAAQVKCFRVQDPMVLSGQGRRWWQTPYLATSEPDFARAFKKLDSTIAKCAAKWAADGAEHCAL